MLGGTFQIGRSALASYQAAIAISGQNIANAANPDYARQTGRLTAQLGGPIFGVSPGGGVLLSELNRHVDEALQARLRDAMGRRDGAQVLYAALSQTEAMYNELSEDDISTQLSEFFAAWAQLQTNPQDVSSRNLIVSKADGLITSMQRMREGLVRQVQDLNTQAAAAAEVVNGLAADLSELNELIVQQESNGRTVAAALRDRRDALLNDLGSLVDITVREQRNGGINVYIGSEPLVQFDRPREIVVETVLEDGLEVASLRFADNGSSVLAARSGRGAEPGGRLPALLSARDAYVRDQLDRFDQLARGLIFEVNKLHSSGVGLVPHDHVVSEYAVDDVNAALNSPEAGLPFTPVNGTLIVHVRDKATGAEITRQIEVDLDGLNGDDTTLTSLAAALDAIPGLDAVVTADRRLELTGGNGQAFWIEDDRSAVMAALGVGGFFTGTDAASMDIVGAIRGDVNRIASSASGAKNDAANAGRIARLASSERVSGLLGNRSIQDFHLDMVGDLAVEAAGAATAAQSADAVHAALFAQREAISGVSMDEEAINLAQFQTAYQGAARYLSVVDELTTEIMQLL